MEVTVAASTSLCDESVCELWGNAHISSSKLSKQNIKTIQKIKAQSRENRFVCSHKRYLKTPVRVVSLRQRIKSNKKASKTRAFQGELGSGSVHGGSEPRRPRGSQPPPGRPEHLPSPVSTAFTCLPHGPARRPAVAKGLRPGMVRCSGKARKPCRREMGWRCPQWQGEWPLGSRGDKRTTILGPPGTARRRLHSPESGARGKAGRPAAGIFLTPTGHSVSEGSWDRGASG